jgi:hypothetical protein
VRHEPPPSSLENPRIAAGFHGKAQEAREGPFFSPAASGKRPAILESSALEIGVGMDNPFAGKEKVLWPTRLL